MTTHRRLHLVTPALLVVPLLLGGCSADDEPRPGPGAEAGSSAAPGDTPAASVDPSKISPSDLPAIPVLRRAEGASGDVDFGDCGTDEGRQVVRATITNQGDRRLDYAVTISWTNDTSDVLARAVTLVRDVPSQGSAETRLRARVPAGVSACTFFVERGRA